MHGFWSGPSTLRAARLPGLFAAPDPGRWAIAALALLAAWLAGNTRTAPPAPAHQPRTELRVSRQPDGPIVHGAPLAPATVEPAPLTAEAQVATLGRQPPRERDPVRVRYLQAQNLYALMQELLPDAAAGERASQYYVYLILGQCQNWLRLDPESARALNERVMLVLNDRPVEERLQWQSEYLRCRDFAGGDLDPLRMAMGADTPGSEVEYASIWFQRAVTAGYPAALAEAALRINLMLPPERKAMLEEAALSGDPDVFWQLFLNSPGEAGDPVSAAGMAWLILACRAGHDCSRNAEWFRGAVCQQEGAGCTPGESAIEHFWYSLTDADRESAFSLAARLKRDLAAGRAEGLPWPALASRNIYENRFAQAEPGLLTDSIR